MDTPQPQSQQASALSGIGLCLSGGGYRAMVFHLGMLIRLNEAGLLPKIARISSVSGGSITAAVLGLNWGKLAFANGVAGNFDIVTDAVQTMAGVTVDVGAVAAGLFLPVDVSDHVTKVYDDTLFKGATLQDLPAAGSGPLFVINATNIQSGALWRFARPFMGDYRVGLVDSPRVSLAAAVTASSAFPPFLSPMTLTLPQPVRAVHGTDLSRPPFTTAAVLSDGGVYDNLGLETVIKECKTILVSDGGKKMEPAEAPDHDWARHSVRVLQVIDNQVRSLRKRSLIDSYNRGDHSGCYWGIGADFANYGLASDPLGCAKRNPAPLAAVATRLEKMPRPLQQQLVNWGYAICDAALRRHLDAATQTQYGIVIAEPKGFPFAGGY
jgi:NTE family protein